MDQELQELLSDVVRVFFGVRSRKTGAEHEVKCVMDSDGVRRYFLRKTGHKAWQELEPEGIPDTWQTKVDKLIAGAIETVKASANSAEKDCSERPAPQQTELKI